MVLIAALLLQSGAADAPPVAVESMTVQQQFDAASADAAQGRCAEAVTMFETLEARLTPRSSTLVRGTIGVRKGICQEALFRDGEAISSLEQGMAILPADNSVTQADRYSAYLALGRLYGRRLDYTRARVAFRAALALAPQENRFEPLVRLARASSFEDQAAGLAYADEALALALAGGRDNRINIASARAARARILLNQGDYRGANVELRQAVADQGGLDRSVTASELVTRADLAIAATLSGDTDTARRYFAFTGTGRLGDGVFGSAADMAPPPCGGPTGLAPDDRAVVEFGIAETGAVSYATPVYVSRGGDAAARTFADAVMLWSWRPEDVVNMQPLLRAFVRVELRCSTAGGAPPIDAFLWSEVGAWVNAQAIEPFDAGDSQAGVLMQARAELARRRAGQTGIGLIPVLMAITTNKIATTEESIAAGEEAIALARAAQAPATVLAGLELAVPRYDTTDARALLVQSRSLLDRPEFANDSTVSSVLRIQIAEALIARRRNVDALPVLQAVVDDARLSRDHPLRVAALVRLANVQAASGTLEAARASYAATGIDAQQCSLVDAQPTRTRTGASSADYPQAALNWGFEGWARVEYDIRPDGRTERQRAVISYPPFVFNDAAEGVARDARYTQSYRPGGDPGCGGASSTVIFQIP